MSYFEKTKLKGAQDDGNKKTFSSRFNHNLVAFFHALCFKREQYQVFQTR
jgi:hypothetical protein